MTSNLLKSHESKLNITHANTEVNNNLLLVHPHTIRKIGYVVSKTATYLKTDLNRNYVDEN